MTAPARTFRIVSSLRTSIVLMIALSLVLLAGVFIPQRAVVGDEAITAAASRSAVASFLFLRLRLSEFSTSPIFIALVTLFFVNLVAVLVSRAAPTIRRLRAKPQTADALLRWTSNGLAIVEPLPAKWSAKHALQTLRGFGYRPSRIADGAVWAVKHRSAPLGFLLFHTSFIVLVLGGSAVWATRSVSIVRLTEGQTFSGEGAKIVRHAPLGVAEPMRFTAKSIDPRFDRGEATDLAVTLGFDGGEQTARVNHPATWGATSVVIGDVGVAPVVWLQDAAGFTLDRAAVPAAHNGKTMLAAGGFDLALEPHVTPRNFPSREQLTRLPIDVTIHQEKRVLYRGTLRPGEIARFDGGALVIPEIRYWASLRLVTERGGALLITGFVFAVAGLVWRLLAQRREVALTWDANTIRLAGAGEFFPLRFRDELLAIADALRSNR
ncbi:MAG: cytochrome c biogenesis protein ResB [Thermoanaerobaculia bacterium]